jgi:hypothetical protein
MLIANLKKVKLTMQDFDIIFSDIMKIKEIHKNLFVELESIVKNINKITPEVGALFCKMAPFLKLYKIYFQNYESSLAKLKECAEKVLLFY